jgi:hypothetical protein
MRQQERIPDETPADGYGAGFAEYTFRTTFRDLCRIYGLGGAKQIADEIIASETERKRQ